MFEVTVTLYCPKVLGVESKTSYENEVDWQSNSFCVMKMSDLSLLERMQVG